VSTPQEQRIGNFFESCDVSKKREGTYSKTSPAHQREVMFTEHPDNAYYRTWEEEQRLGPT
jgi:hypothetical protein